MQEVTQLVQNTIGEIASFGEKIIKWVMFFLVLNKRGLKYFVTSQPIKFFGAVLVVHGHRVADCCYISLVLCSDSVSYHGLGHQQVY